MTIRSVMSDEGLETVLVDDSSSASIQEQQERPHPMPRLFSRTDFSPATSEISGSNSCQSNGAVAAAKPALRRLDTVGRSELNEVYQSMINKQSYGDLYRNEKRLQNGSYGVVYECLRVVAATETATASRDDEDSSNKDQAKSDAPQKYAVKIIDRLKLKKMDDHAVFREVKILSELVDVPNVITLIDFFVEPKTLYVVQQLAEGGDVFDRLLQRQHYTEEVARTLARTLIQTLATLHERKIVHRDLKPGNLLLAEQNDDCSILLADFGFATHLGANGTCRTRCGTPCYVAPEIILDTPYTQAVDMWSCGCILYMLLCGYEPFHGDNIRAVFRQVRAGNFTFHNESWKNVSIPAKQMIVHLLTVNPKHRWTAEQALESPWIKTRTPGGKELSNNDLSGALGRIRTRRKLKAAMEAVRWAATAQFWNPQKTTFSQHVKVWDKLGGSRNSKIESQSSETESLKKATASNASESSSEDSGATSISSKTSSPPPSPTIKPASFADRYTVVRQVRRGDFATVWECLNKITENVYAVKIIPRPHLSTIQDEQVLNEVSILQAVSTENPEVIVQLVDFYEEEEAFYIVMELMSGGNVYDRLAQRSHYSECDARNLIKRLLEAVETLHKKNIVHKDIKPQNMLLRSKNNDFDMKLCDFSFARRVHTPESLTYRVGTPPYVAPEVLKNIPHDERVDLWSVGITSFVLLVGYSPFVYDSREMICQQIKAGEWKFNEQDWRNISPDTRELIKGLLQVDPMERLSASEALQSKWMQHSDEALSGRDLKASLAKLKTRRRMLKHFSQNTLTWIANKTDNFLHLGFVSKPIEAKLPTHANELIDVENSLQDLSVVTN